MVVMMQCTLGTNFKDRHLLMLMQRKTPPYRLYLVICPPESKWNLAQGNPGSLNSLPYIIQRQFRAAIRFGFEGNFFPFIIIMCNHNNNKSKQPVECSWCSSACAKTISVHLQRLASWVESDSDRTQNWNWRLCSHTQCGHKLEFWFCFAHMLVSVRIQTSWVVNKLSGQ